MKINPLKISVIGLGYWGPNLVRNISSSDVSILSSICDLNEEQLNKVGAQYPSAKKTSNIDDILNSDVDAVAIATPVNTHYKLAKMCLEAGKHVLLEKPMTRTIQESEELLALASSKGLTLMVDHTFNYTSAVTKIKEVVSKTEIGDLLYWDSVRVNLGLFQHDVNVIWDLAPHDLSIIDYVVGKEPVSVNAKGIAHYDSGIEDIAYLTLNYDDSFIAHFHFNWLSPVKVRQTLIGGKNKMIVYDDMESSEKIKIYDKGVDLSKSKEGLYNSLVQYRLGDMYCPQLPNSEALSLEIKHFYDVVRNGTTPISGGDSGLRVVKILEAAQKSIDNNGGEVSL